MMNRLLLFLVLTFAAAMQTRAQDIAAVNATAQEHNHEKLGQIKNNAASDSCRTYYMEIKGTVNPTTGALMVSMDIGKMLSTRIGFPPSLLNAVAKEMRFGSMADAMNTIAQYRWKLVDTYTITSRGQTAVYWVVSKEVKNPIELLEGFGAPTENKTTTDE